MRNLIVTEFISLDGVIENPGWTFPYWNDEIQQFKIEETGSGQDILLGRVTYEAFASVWPTSKDEGAPYFNGTRKYVMSNTLDGNGLTWNNSVQLSGDLVTEITRLKQQDGSDIVVHGSGKLADSLIQNGLVDRLRLLVYPVVIGKGQRLFENETAAKLTLLEARPISNGVVGLIYEPIRK